MDAMSQELQSLRLLATEKQAENPDTGKPATFTEAEVKQFRVRLAGLTDSEDAIIADKIVSSLNNTSRSVRLDAVPQAHKDTFQWAFDSRLSDWLLFGRGTFWVSGKPGSGKSTFMKFIANHPKTRELLVRWAGSSDTLAVAVHFFWDAGTPIQKSWQGLLQSLLVDLLRAHPSLVALAVPNRCAAAKAGQWQIAAEPWSVPELCAAMRALATADLHVPLRMCFFIDPLDEYDSDHAELCQALRDMTRSPRIKMCLSSRRSPVFERSFGWGYQKSLDVHELTGNDIRKFVTDQLQDHARWTAEVSEEIAWEKAELMDRIVSQAGGVFLWAFLVTRSLLEGLSNGESIRDLNRRFSQLPSDLDQLFQHILESVSPADQPKMASILQVAVHALGPLDVDLYWHLEQEFGKHVFGLRYRVILLRESEPPEGIAERRDKIIRSINEKTKGLLTLVHNRVEFLHRTVRDFVSTKDTGEYLRRKLPEHYSAFVAIGAAYLGLLGLGATCTNAPRSIPGVIRQGQGLTAGPFIANLNQGLVYVSEARKQAEQSGSTWPEVDRPRQAHELLEEYEAAVNAMVSQGLVTTEGVNAPGCHQKLLFRQELLRHEVPRFLASRFGDEFGLASRFRDEVGVLGIFDESPLFTALAPMCLSSGESPPPVPEVLDFLLRQGEDPNVIPRQLKDAGGAPATDTPSPWVLFARTTMSAFNTQSGPCVFPSQWWNHALKHGTFTRLMAYGADPNRPLLNRPGARTVFSHFLDISLSKFLGEECFEDYLATLDTFLRAGAKLGVPRNLVPDGAVTDSGDWEVAVGDLVRRRPEESVLATFCGELRGLLARLVADPQRAVFVSSVVTMLILHCEGNKDDLRELGSAISRGCPAYIAAPLLQLVTSEMSGGQLKEGPTRKRVQDEDCVGGESGSRTKHPRRV